MPATTSYLGPASLRISCTAAVRPHRQGAAVWFRSAMILA